MLDRYHLEHELGTGARGAVYRGRERATGRVVAVKLIAHRQDGAGSCHGAFAARDLAHPDIPAIYGSEYSPHLQCIVMEFVQGIDLRAHSHPDALLPLSVVLAVVARVAGALHHAHEHGVVHGDVKPANIVFDASTAAVKLTDFNFDTDVAPGTPAYMAPENLAGTAPSPAADQFSLAVTLFELACGHRPFKGRSRAEIVHRVLSAPHDDIRVRNRSAPPGLADVFDRALAKNPGARYPSAEAMKRALDQVQSQLLTGHARGRSARCGICERDAP